MPRSGLWERLYRAGLQKTLAWRSTAVGRLVAAPVVGVNKGLRGTVLRVRGRAFRPADTVFITGTPRSGTTWLADLLLARGASCLVFQPVEEWSKARPDLRDGFARYLSPDSNWPVGERLFGGLLDGTAVSALSLRHAPLGSVFRATSLTVKSVRANRLLPWLAAKVPIGRRVLITRHPCAVVASWIMHSQRKDEASVQAPERRYVEEHVPRLAGHVGEIRRREEALAVRWCCEQHWVLQHAPAGAWEHVHYEQLVLDGPRALERLCRRLGFAVTEAALAGLARNSQTVGRWSADHSQASARQRLAGWTSRLNSDDIKHVLAMVEAFGITGYSQDAIPDFDQVGVAT